jgi:hypothetical protein
VKAIDAAVFKSGAVIVGAVELVEAIAVSVLQLFLLATDPPTLSRQLPAAPPA